MSNWTQYFTPPQIAERLVDAIDISFRPKTAADICAGSGNLLAAVRKQWPSIKLTGNDKHLRVKPSNISEWACMDGRDYARHMLSLGCSYDIVVANPPFGVDSRCLTSN